MIPMYLLHRLGVCPSALRWVRRHRHRSAEELRARCPSVYWLDMAAFILVRESWRCGVQSSASDAVRFARFDARKETTPHGYRAHVPWSLVAPMVELLADAVHGSDMRTLACGRKAGG